MPIEQDEQLSWKDHIDLIALKIARGLGVINSVRLILQQNVLLMLFAIFYYDPYFTYCNIFWGSSCAIFLNNATKVCSPKYCQFTLISTYKFSFCQTKPFKCDRYS